MRLLNFLRLTDQHDGNLSITNLAVLIVLAKVAMTTDVSIVDAGALLVTLVSYQGKKVINKNASVTQDDIASLRRSVSHAYESIEITDKRMDELSSKVTQTQMAMGLKERK